MVTVAAAAGMASARVTAAPEAMSTAETVATATEAMATAGKTAAAAAKARRGSMPSPETLESARVVVLSICPREGIRWRPADSVAEIRRGRSISLRGSRVSRAASPAVILHGASVWARAVPRPLSVSREWLQAGSVGLKSTSVALRSVP
jgi:hypothetical protein